MEIPTVLILDFDDSYTKNLLKSFNHLPNQLWNNESVQDRVMVINVNSISWNQLVTNILPSTSCIILGPGPGTPHKKEDFSWPTRLIDEYGDKIPIFGLCLGHQGLATTFGGKVIQSPCGPKHGQISSIRHRHDALFAGVPEMFDAVQYNSLTVDPASLPESLQVIAECDGIVMALKHRERPLWGVQFHPESIASTYGPTIISNFLLLATSFDPSLTLSNPFPPPIQSLSTSYLRGQPNQIPDLPKLDPNQTALLNFKKWDLRTVELGCGDVLPQEVFEDFLLKRVGEGKEKGLGEIWLDSARPAPTAQLSHIFAPQFILSYSLHTDTVQTISSPSPSSPPLQLQLSPPKTFFTTLGTAQSSLNRLTRFPDAAGPSVPVGFVGYIGYEMKDVTLNIARESPIKEEEERVADSEFAFCSLLLTFDHEKRKWLASGLVRTEGGVDDGRMGEMEGRFGVKFGVGEDEWTEWLGEVRAWFARGRREGGRGRAKEMGGVVDLGLVPDQDRKTYMTSIESAQASIVAGESYELCLTTQFRAPPPSLPPYSLYLSLRQSNPAPYSSYFHLTHNNLHLLSSSPEKFMQISKEGHVEMKPIKGTALRDLRDPVEDERRRNALREDEKERAENLMIVDLCRNDLLGFCEVHSVEVPKLMVVETYQTVHQLVTSIQGKLSPAVNPFEAVSRAFPPGSMTGAPKLRSVKLLEDLEEHKPRGVYSGVFGFVGVDGTTDFSVVIRTLVIRENEMTLGAGGAITHLSQAASEWDEVLIKKNAVVGKLVRQAV